MLWARPKSQFFLIVDRFYAIVILFNLQCQLYINISHSFVDSVFKPAKFQWLIQCPVSCTVHLNVYQTSTRINNYKTCLYNLFVCLYTKNTKDPPVIFHKMVSLHFISKHLNPSNYKTCLYNLFVCLYTKIPKTLLCFFHKTLHISYQNT